LQDRFDSDSQMTDAALNRLVSGIPPRPDPSYAPLSFAQERHWFQSLLQPGNPAHQHGVTVRLAGPLDRAAMQRALSLLVMRHETLRAVFCLQAGLPALAIMPNTVAVALPFFDFSDLNTQVAETRTQAAIEEDARRVFDLCAAPLLRATLYGLGQQRHVLHLAVPAFAADAASLLILAQDLCALYAQVGQGKRPATLNPAAQHPDFAVWQRGQDFSEQTARQLESLAGAAIWLPLAGRGQLLPDGEQYPGAPWESHLEQTALPEGLARALRELAAVEDAPLETVLLAVLACLIRGHTGEADFLIGLPATRRAHSDLAASVGPYADFTPLHARLGGVVTFRDSLRVARRALTEARAFPNLPFGHLLSAANLPRLPGCTVSPLFQASFMLNQDNPPRPSTCGELRYQIQPLENHAALVDLALEIRESSQSGALQARMRCRASLFGEQATRILLNDFLALLELVSADPDLPLEALDTAQHSHAQPAGAVTRLPLPAPVLPHLIAPRTPLEGALAEIWQELLKSPLPVGVETSFFDLGGDSLRAVRLIERIRAGWGQKLPLTLIFQSPTVAAMAAALHDRLAVHGSTLIALQPDGARLPFFCVAAPDKLPALAALARALGPERPVYGLQDSSAPPKRGNEVEVSAARFEAALRVAQPYGPYLLGGIGQGGPAAMVLARRLQRSGEKVLLLALVDSQAPPQPANQRFMWLRKLFRRAMARSTPYDGPTLLLRSKPRAVLAGDPALGWGRVAASVDIRSVPIARADLLAEAHAPELAAILRPALDQAG